jgi:hypothetical protein
VTNDPGGGANDARTAGDAHAQFESMPPLPALRSLTQCGRDLLRRTAELPDTEQGLLTVLAEYRYAVFNFVAVADRL